jgi:hypothetical protein
VPRAGLETGSLADGVVAGLVAAVVSGVPSTAHALATGRDPLEATLAAGSIALPQETDRVCLLAAAVPVHLAVSIGWGIVLARVLPRRHTVVWGGLAGLGIAALDLGLAARALPRIRALPLAPQLADHALYGTTVGAVLRLRRSGAGA